MGLEAVRLCVLPTHTPLGTGEPYPNLLVHDLLGNTAGRTLAGRPTLAVSRARDAADAVETFTRPNKAQAVVLHADRVTLTLGTQPRHRDQVTGTGRARDLFVAWPWRACGCTPKPDPPHPDRGAAGLPAGRCAGDRTVSPVPEEPVLVRGDPAPGPRRSKRDADPGLRQPPVTRCADPPRSVSGGGGGCDPTCGA
jgi:hypothetical protein